MPSSDARTSLSLERSSVLGCQGKRSENSAMALFSVRPTRLDRVVADEVAAHTNPAIEEVAKIITWRADEHVFCLAAAACRLYCRKAPARQRLFSDHVFVCSLVASILPHALKTLV